MIYVKHQSKKQGNTMKKLAVLAGLLAMVCVVPSIARANDTVIFCWQMQATPKTIVCFNAESKDFTSSLTGFTLVPGESNNGAYGSAANDTIAGNIAMAWTSRCINYTARINLTTLAGNWQNGMGDKGALTPVTFPGY